jgi:hypothetical protein
MIAMLAGYTYWLGQPLLQDGLNRWGRLEIAEEVQVTKATCRSKLLIVGICSVKLTGPRLGLGLEGEYLILAPHWQYWGPSVIPMRSLESPSYATTNLQYGIFWNALVCFGLLWMLLACATWWAIKDYVFAPPAKRQRKR